MRPLRPAGSAATVAVALALIGCLTVSSCSAGTDFDPGSTTNSTTEATAAAISDGRLYPVVKVADGDTVTVVIDGVRQRVRLLGIDAPELGSPGECFGRESADRAAALLTGTSVQLIADDTQDDRDRYGRLLRYVVLADGTLVNGMLVRDGDAREYTYDEPYRYQQQFRALEEEARASGAGIWSADCRQQSNMTTPEVPNTAVPNAAVSNTAVSNTAGPTSGTTQDVPDPNCPIKGNINAKGDRIYHVPGNESYAETVITPAKGERWFCSAEEAQAAGWRAAKN